MLASCSPGPDAVFKGVHPFLVLPDGDHEHHRCIEGAPGQSPDFFQGFRTLEHVHPVGLVVVASGSDPSRFQDGLHFFLFNGFVAEFPYRISGLGQVHECHLYAHLSCLIALEAAAQAAASVSGPLSPAVDR